MSQQQINHNKMTAYLIICHLTHTQRTCNLDFFYFQIFNLKAYHLTCSLVILFR